MARASSIDRLPEPLVSACEAAIKSGKTIDDITAMLNARGADVSRSAVGRKHKGYRELVAEQRKSREIAQAFADEFRDLQDDGDMGALMTQQMQLLVMHAQRGMIANLDEAEEIDIQAIGRLSKSVRELAGAAKTDFEREQAIRAAAIREAREQAANDAETAVQGRRRDAGDHRQRPRPDPRHHHLTRRRKIMSWEIIDNLAPPKAQTVPPKGVRVEARSLTLKKQERTARYIRIHIGAELAKAAAMTHETQQVMLMLGGGSENGKIAIGVSSSGKFTAKRQKNSGRYTLTVNEASAEGLFALAFETFRVADCEVIRPENGQPVRFAFRASEAMLDAD